jgi:hypothetical protein
MEQEISTKSNQNIIVGVVVVLLLGVATFVGGQLLSKSSSEETAYGDEYVQQLTSFLETADGIPEDLPKLVGTVSEINGNSLFVATSNTSGVFGAAHGMVANGPIVEIVITRDTLLLVDVSAKDITSQSGNNNGNHSSGGVFTGLDRVIESGVLEEIQLNDSVFIWGERVGDRIIAKTILYVIFPQSIHQ